MKRMVTIVFLCAAVASSAVGAGIQKTVHFTDSPAKATKTYHLTDTWARVSRGKTFYLAPDAKHADKVIRVVGPGGALSVHVTQKWADAEITLHLTETWAKAQTTIHFTEKEARADKGKRFYVTTDSPSVDKAKTYMTISVDDPAVRDNPQMILVILDFFGFTE